MTEFVIEKPEGDAPEELQEDLGDFGGLYKTPEVEASKPATPIFSLKSRRAEILKKLHIDLRVPRYEEPEVWVRFSPVDTTLMNASVTKHSKTKEKDWGLKANAEVLINSCVGIYAVFPENPDEKFSLREDEPNGEWTKFDMALAKALDIIPDEHAPAISVVRKFYFADGDLVDTTERLLRWSNVSNNEADTVF
jgi:hypothetical protein